jgi:hypothetical protein
LLDGQYADPQADAFLDFLRTKSARVVLLTSGNEHFQRTRLAKTGLERHFDDIVIVHRKKESAVRTAIRARERGLFVNDELKQNMVIRDAFPSVMVVTKRHPVKYTDAELRASGIPYFSTLNAISSYVNESIS